MNEKYMLGIDSKIDFITLINSLNLIGEVTDLEIKDNQDNYLSNGSLKLKIKNEIKEIKIISSREGLDKKEKGKNRIFLYSDDQCILKEIEKKINKEFNYN